MPLPTLEQLWTALRALADAYDAAPMNKHEGCWSIALDQHWSLAVNAHPAAARWTNPRSGDSHTVPAFSVYLDFNGWPAGLIDPHGAHIAAGRAANADTFLAAVDAAVRRRQDALQTPHPD